MEWLENFKYRIRTEKPKLMQRLDDNTYYGGNLGGVTITKKRKKPYKWVSPRGAGNMTVMPGDPEMIFFAPIATGAGIAASPAITSTLGSAMSGINTAGDALAATAAGQRLTSGLNFVANAARSSKAWPWIDAGLTSVFGAHGIDKVASGDIHNVGDVVETGLDLLPLTQLVRPVVNTASRVGNTVRETVNSTVDKLPWTYRIPENSNMAYRRMSPIERDWIMEGNELSTRATNKAVEGEATMHKDYLISKGKGKGITLRPKKGGQEHGGRKQFAKGQPWAGTTTTAGEEQVLAIPGEGLPWVSGRHYHGPQGNSFEVGNVPFEEAPFGSHIDLLTKEGYTGVNPSLLNGSVIYSPFKIFGRSFGYKKLYPTNTSTPRGLISREPLIARGVPEITVENAASITPEQWTAAQDAAIARGDMAEALRLRDLHFKVSAPNTEITDIQYHGSPYTFNIFDPTKRGNRDQGWFGKGYYFTPSKDYAAMYGETRPFYINAEDVYTKGEGNIWFGKESSPQAKVWLKMQEKRGRGPKAEAILDDLRFSDAVRDAMPQTKPYNGIFEEVVTRNNNQMKLADAVTYDDNGVRIPLGERDNFKLNDIRYSWLAPFLGLGTLGTLLNKQ